MSDTHDVIEAFADGEPVDPVALEQALADPAGRAHLIDLVVLRTLVKRSTVLVPPVVVEGSAPVARRTLRWLAAAAVVVMAASVGGYFIGERVSSRRAADPGTAGTAVTEPPAPAPAPTMVITFQPGVDWTERGGH